MEEETAAAHTGATTTTELTEPPTIENLVLETRAARAPETTLDGYMLQLETLLGRRWDEDDLIRTRFGLVEVTDYSLSLEDVVESDLLFLRGQTQDPELLAATLLGYYRLSYAALPAATGVHSPETEDWLETYLGVQEYANLWANMAYVESDDVAAWENALREVDEESGRSSGRAYEDEEKIVHEQLKKLKTREFDGEDERHEDCSVCFEDLYRGKVIALDCSHDFHFHCLRRWFLRGRNTCPLCRARAIRH